MQLSSLVSWITVFVALVVPSSATRLIKSDSLNVCMDSSNFTVSYFNVKYTANNNTLMLDFDINSQISGKVTANISLSVYGYKALSKSVNPCDMGQGLAGLCPMVAGKINQKMPVTVPSDAARQIPSKFLSTYL